MENRLEFKYDGGEIFLYNHEKKFTGLYDDNNLLYLNGKLFNGFSTKNLYDDIQFCGKNNINIDDITNYELFFKNNFKFYSKGILATVCLKIEDELLCIKEGELYSGVYDNKYFIGGKLGKGFNQLDDLMYFNGRLSDNFNDETKIKYSQGKKLYSINDDDIFSYYNKLTLDIYDTYVICKYLPTEIKEIINDNIYRHHKKYITFYFDKNGKLLFDENHYYGLEIEYTKNKKLMDVILYDNEHYFCNYIVNPYYQSFFSKIVRKIKKEI